jgi:hypothetical protein
MVAITFVDIGVIFVFHKKLIGSCKIVPSPSQSPTPSSTKDEKKSICVEITNVE